MPPRLSKALNCHGCGSPDHKKDVCPHVDWGISKPAAEKGKAVVCSFKPAAEKKKNVAHSSCARLTHEESCRIQQLALVQLKQELVGMTVQPGDHPLLKIVQKVMRMWKAVSVPVIVEKALHELGLESRVREGAKAVLVVAPEIICISSDDDSLDPRP